MMTIKEIKKLLGWCPDQKMVKNVAKNIEFSNYIDTVHEVNGGRFQTLVVGLHFVVAIWLIFTALKVLSNHLIFPWWIMNINLVASSLILVIGLVSLIIAFDLGKIKSSHRMLSLINIAFVITFFVYLSQYLARIRGGSGFLMLFSRPFINYSFDILTLTTFSAFVIIPSLLTLRFRPNQKEGKTGKGIRPLLIVLLIILVVTTGIGAYYVYLNQQKDNMLIGEFGDGGEIKLYSVEDERYSFGWSEDSTYVIDSKESTSGHAISQDTYDAIQFLKATDTSNVLSWWDYALETKIAGKEPVINYASENIKWTVARPTAIEEYDSEDKVRDVANFFVYENEEESQEIARKYNADYIFVHYPWDLWKFSAIVTASGKDPGDYIKGNFTTNKEWMKEVENRTLAKKDTVGIKMIYGDEVDGFEKVFENDDVRIYRVK